MNNNKVHEYSRQFVCLRVALKMAQIGRQVCVCVVSVYQSLRWDSDTLIFHMIFKTSLNVLCQQYDCCCDEAVLKASPLCFYALQSVVSQFTTRDSQPKQRLARVMWILENSSDCISIGVDV